jgi:serine/threonine protein kinase
MEGIVSRSDVATVFRAVDMETGQVVAIKVPHPEVEGDQIFAERFQREQEIGKHLDHPGLLKVISGGHRSRNYIVMEWADGKLLREILNEERKLSPERASKITVGICEALSYIHNHGIVHRDLKPEHVLVVAYDDIKLIDFGMAGQTGAPRITFANLSRITSSPAYVSPEQVKGKRGDARSDLYSLGVMLYEMVTGTLPFHGADAFAVMNDRLLSNPVPPRELDPAIRPQLQEVIYRALEREPQYRYANAHELAFDLEHLDHVGVAERPEIKDWKKKRATATKKFTLYAALILVPLLLFALLLYLARR